MNHLIVSREYPPSSYPQGGIGTYVAHIARLLAQRGETVHVIGERWHGAPRPHEVQCDGRLVIHRVAVDNPIPGYDVVAEQRTLRAMLRSDFPSQAFAWQAARLAESLVDDAAIDCIEAQEYEAPLYYFLLRRGLGLGPTRQPPCVVHLHSPTQIICHHNNWDIGRPAYLTMKRLEDYVIQASDAALCPSRHLGREVERHYGLAEGSVERIALPHGDTPLISREASTWQEGTICYVGRMEPRKGLFEWVDAAVAVARERPGLHFELIGSDTPLSGSGPSSVRAALLARIPADVRSAVACVAPVPRGELWQRLARARFAVVPSRWENYPNTCVEAMSTGLPVIVSREGGMIEMVEDGRTGWVADAVTTDALAVALRRALDTPPATLARMGAEAAAAIRALCDNTSIVDRHIAFRTRVVAEGAARSKALPRQMSSTILFGPLRGSSERPRTAKGGQGVAMVVELARGDRVDDVIEDLLNQSERPVAVVLDAAELSSSQRLDAELRLVAARLPVVPGRSDEESTAIGRALAADSGSVAIGIRASGCRLAPGFVEHSARIFATHPSLGVMSHWHSAGRRADSGFVRPAPARPYQWLLDDVSPCTAFRVQALRAIDWVTRIQGGSPSAGDVTLAILVDGWEAVTYPEFLSRRVHPSAVQRRGLEQAAGVRLRQLLQSLHGDRWAADASEALALVRGTTAPAETGLSAAQLLALPLKDQVRVARDAIRNPGLVFTWLRSRTRALRRGRRT